MAAAAHAATRLAFDDEGAGTPVVFLHGLTFDRRSWRPVVERLGGSVRSIAVDLPAHGESGGAPAPLEQVAAQVHELLASLAVERPIVVGHSMMGGLAALYALAHPTRGVVMVDNGPDVRPFAELVHRLAARAARPRLLAGLADVRGQPRARAHPRAGALTRARRPSRDAGSRGRLLGAAASQRSG